MDFTGIYMYIYVPKDIIMKYPAVQPSVSKTPKVPQEIRCSKERVRMTTSGFKVTYSDNPRLYNKTPISFPIYHQHSLGCMLDNILYIYSEEKK